MIWLSVIYLAAAAALAVYGFWGLFTLLVYWRYRHTSYPAPLSPTVWPLVTVQLPVFNEQFVIERLIDAAAALDYPRDCLHIQVLDDSTDETTALAAAKVTQYQNQGFHITLHHRHNREGYKAGALATGLQLAQGEFMAIFDADFQPKPDFLRQTVPHFLTDPQLGMIQVRWEHLNHHQSSLTAAQAIAMDKHFAIDQAVRFRANYFPKFNGSGGIWRRECLERSGGWQDDTVCEDLCLSTRAVLHGWRFQFLPHVTAPAELPLSMTAYKNQQARWAKGSAQCLSKFGREILSNQAQSVVGRGYALLSMSAYTASLWVILVLLTLVPLVYLRYPFPPWLLALSMAGLSQPVLFSLSQQFLHQDWGQRLRHLPTLLLVAIGLSPAIGRGLIQAWTGKQHVFVRTPKGEKGQQVYRLPFDGIIFVELGLALYAAAGLGICLLRQTYGPALFLFTCLLGLGMVGLSSLREQFVASRHY